MSTCRLVLAIPNHVLELHMTEAIVSFCHSIHHTLKEKVHFLFEMFTSFSASVIISIALLTWQRIM